MKQELPAGVAHFQNRYPQVWEAFAERGARCNEAGGPLDDNTRRLVKVAIAAASQHQGAVHSAVRHALASGVAPEELAHVAILAITTIGWPAAYAALTWIDETVAAGGNP